MRDKYKRFYNERIQDMRSKHFKSRHTASGLIAYFEPGRKQQRMQGGPTVENIVQHAKEIVRMVDILQKCTNESSNPNEVKFPTFPIRSTLTFSSCCLRANVDDALQPFSEVQADQPRSTVALYSGSKEAGAEGLGCVARCIEELDRIVGTSSRGRLAVESCEKLAGTELCGIIDAVNGADGESNQNLGQASAAAGCVCQAIDDVCTSKSRTVICLVPYIVLKRGSNPAHLGQQQQVFRFPIVSAALLHARVEHSWVQRIAVIDLVRPIKSMGSSVDAQILHISPIKDSEAQTEFEAERLVCRTQWAAARESPSKDPQAAEDRSPFVDRWKKGLENEVLPRLKEFKPQLLLVSIESILHLEGSRNARKLSAQNFLWAGRFLAQNAAAISSGRLVVIWDMAGGSSWVHRSVADFVRGILEVQGAAT